MITKEKAIEIAKKYLHENDWNYIYLDEENVVFQESEEVHVGKYEDIKRDLYHVFFDMEGYIDPILYVLYIDTETGEVLYVLGPHGSINVLE